jgi:Xaa-Pro aminopeptidase
MAQDGKTDSPTEVIEKRGHVLSEFLWTLYAKFESIAEGHRVIHDVIAAIVEREGIPKSNSLAGGFKELWKLYQSEVRKTANCFENNALLIVCAPRFGR